VAAKLPIEVVASDGLLLGMSAEDFLRDYWQRRPLLIRRAYPKFECPLSGDDLAALAMREEALSRLLRYHRRSGRWTLSHGPLDEQDFADLPQTDWTLLVQDVDKWDPDVAELLRDFQFLPSWRIDDIMVSFAAPGGSVGAHVDHYDVFLLQGLGHRQWAIDASGKADLGYRDDTPMKLLRQFNTSHQWLLGPGDMLYLPPGIPHHGVATDACLSLSIGMRAPAVAELLGPLLEEHAQRLGDEARFTDPGRGVSADPSALEQVDIDRLRAQLGQSLTALQQLPDDQLGDFFARFLSQYRQAQQPQAKARKPSLNSMEKALARGKVLVIPRWFKALRRLNEPEYLYLGGDRSALAEEAINGLLSSGIDYPIWAQLNPAYRAKLRELLAEGLLELRR